MDFHQFTKYYNIRTCIKQYHIWLYFIIVGLCDFTRCENVQDFQKSIPARVIWTAENKDVQLPCDISAPTANDAPKLVLWFKDSTGIPLYSLDSRAGGPIKHASHSALSSDLGQRIYFSVDSSPKDAHLRIKDVKYSDGGVYRCRVDFFNSATRNIRINLTLAVPPEEPRMFDKEGNEVSHIAGPFLESMELFLSCQVTGGNPQPNVSWWMGNQKLNGTSHPSVVEGLSAIVNQLFISTVKRSFFGQRIECRAQGSPFLEPTVKNVMLQIHLKPTKIKIISANDLIMAGKSVPLRCETFGSYPPAKMSWILDGEPLRNADITSHTDVNSNIDANMTVSILNLKVSAENDGAELICRATNPWFSGSAIEDKRIISVAYPPSVSVHLANEDPNRVVTRSEKENVTLKCRADAKPPVTSYSWYKNSMRMSGEQSETLFLTYLQRESGGAYSCGAENSEGETRSATLLLKVQFAPRCKPGTEQTSVGALNMHSMQVKCEVEADPPESVRFSWTYNNTRNVSPVLNSRITSNGLNSALTYLPQTDAELITLACWASNSIGRQVTPCLIHILPANTPEPPSSCELHNDTILEIVCVPGNDGGLTQYFLLEVVGGNPIYTTELNKNVPDFIENNELSTMNDEATTAPLRHLRQNIPEFKLHDLEPGREYQFLVYAVNAKGRSDPPIVMNARSIGDTIGPHDETILSENPTPAETSKQGIQKQSTLVILVGVVAAGVVVVTAIIVAGIVVVCKHQTKPPEPQDVRKRMRPARTDVPSMYAEDDGIVDEFTRSADIRCSRASGTRSSRYVSEGFVQYSQPSLNVYITDPDLILPRGDIIEFTTTTPTPITQLGTCGGGGSVMTVNTSNFGVKK